MWDYRGLYCIAVENLYGINHTNMNTGQSELNKCTSSLMEISLCGCCHMQSGSSVKQLKSIQLTNSNTLQGAFQMHSTPKVNSSPMPNAWHCPAPHSEIVRKS